MSEIGKQDRRMDEAADSEDRSARKMKYFACSELNKNELSLRKKEPVME